MIKTLENFSEDPGILDALEAGAVIHLPHLHFAFHDDEQGLFSPAIMPVRAKNISYDPRSQSLKAFGRRGPQHPLLKNMLQRYADFSTTALTRLFPHYTPALIQARTSYRPVEIKDRIAPSQRKDDSRLHVDAFPASPNQGQQLLRVFCNVNPLGIPRVWRIGEPFAQVVRHFKNKLSIPLPVTKHILHALHITRGLRTDYDALMLQLHDLMKIDNNYQQTVDQQLLALTGTWIVFTDQVSHAALSGQYCLEQTFRLPPLARKQYASSPLNILEQAFDRVLI